MGRENSKVYFEIKIWMNSHDYTIIIIYKQKTLEKAILMKIFKVVKAVVPKELNKTSWLFCTYFTF